MDTMELLRDLSQATGVSGYEGEPRAVARRALAPFTDEQQVDALGNLITLKRGMRAPDTPPHSIMLAAHMDEIGLMVTDFDEGFLRFTTVGGVDTRTILGQEVIVHGKRPLPGIVASRPPHVLPESEQEKALPIEELFIDVGVSEERIQELTRVGDFITMRREFLPLAKGYASGKALDNRAGVVTLVGCMEALNRMQHSWDVYAVATSQEEVGLRGATVSAYDTAPDIAIAVDVGYGLQQGVKEKEAISMDKGGAIGIGPNFHPLMAQRLIETAEKYEVKYQREIIAGRSGTDAWAIQVAREGIPTALISIPLRYMHTSVETVCIRDIDRIARLMALFIAELDQSFAEALGLPKGEG
ncbi:MAG: M42 family metallopeptidase [Chloroflexota bacterium]|nr:M42 family metallopeptidase [Chloroflexota bacterium]